MDFRYVHSYKISSLNAFFSSYNRRREGEDYYWKQECIIGFLQNAVPWLALYIKQVNGCSANFKQLNVSPYNRKWENTAKSNTSLPPSLPP